MLSGVLDGIVMASKVSTGLRKALAFRATELAGLVPQERVPRRIGEQPVGGQFLRSWPLLERSWFRFTHSPNEFQT